MRDEWERTRFLPGTRPLLTVSCEPEPDCDGCSHSDGRLRERSLPSEVEIDVTSSSYIRTKSYLGPRRAAAEELEAETLTEATKIVEGLGASVGEDTSEMGNVVVAQPNGEDIQLAATDSPRLALLSFDERDGFLGGYRPRFLGRFPVFAAAPPIAGAAAMVRLRALVRTSQEQTSLMPISRYVDGESEVIGEWPLATSVGEYTTIVGEIPAGASSGFDIPLLMELELRSGDAVLDNLFVQVLTRDPRLT
jgi:hypothetical protein